jgi:C4-dicarboxylate-specific signal transduction histidine kinase
VEEELKRAQDELERRVEERTNKLMKVNEKLEMEIAERERAERELRMSHRKLELALAVTSQLCSGGGCQRSQDRVSHEHEP